MHMKKPDIIRTDLSIFILQERETMTQHVLSVEIVLTI